MNKNDKRIMDILKKELENSSESANIPLRLQKESIVTMLKNAETDFSDKTGTKSKSQGGSVALLRRLTAIAAMLAIVVSGVLVMKTGGVMVVKTDSFYDGYKSASPVKNAGSYEEVEKAVEEILAGKTEKLPAEKTTNKNADRNNTDSEKPQLSEETTKSGLIGGYSEYVAIANQAVMGTIKEGIEKHKDANESDGVMTYGDFKADIVKTDGKYLYIVSTGFDKETGDTVEQIKIVRTLTDGSFETVSTIVLSEGISKRNFDECIEIYLKNNCLTAIMKRHRYTFGSIAGYDDVSTLAVFYDISDPYSPEKVREHVQDGEYISSNLYENRLCLVTAKSIPVSKNDESQTAIPIFSVDGVQKKLDAQDIFIAVNDPEASYLFVTVTDVENFSNEVGCFAMLGCGKDVYCSSSAIAVAREFVSLEADKENYRNSFTEIYRFNIEGSSIVFSGSYVVQGSLAGGVFIDEKTGCLAALTTDKTVSCFYVLNSKMEFVSGLKGIFPGDEIQSIKFIGSNAYVMVDGNEEKTMIIDFSNTSFPKVAGKIDSKAFSDSLYAVSDTLLIGVNETKDGIINLTLFDVSDPSNPEITATYSLDESCRSVSADDGRSVMLVKDKELFGIPVLKKDEKSGTEISAYVLFDVSGGKLVQLGIFNHDISYIADAAVRGTFIKDILYTVSGEKVVAFNIFSETNKQTELSLY